MTRRSAGHGLQGRLEVGLQQEYETLGAAMAQQEDFSDPQVLTGALALVPHAAYHLGAIRQLVNALEPRV